MDYTLLDRQPSLPASRQRLANVLSNAGDIIHIHDAQAALGLTRNEAAKLLSRWLSQGWLRRVGRGAYAPVSLDTLGSTHVLDDPWILVPALFDPAYIGGRSAAEHWDLTEQMFRDILVVTAQSVRHKTQIRHGATFTLKHISKSKFFGTKSLWRGEHTKVLISDLHRTIIDMLDDPRIGGGIQHVGDCLSAYFARDDRDDETLISYAERLGNGAVFKRLGFLAERHQAGEFLIESCRARRTTGHAKLDPHLPSPRLITRWRLRVPDSWANASVHD